MSIFRSWLAAPLHAHPGDPPTQHDAADRLGKFVATGLIEAEDALPQLVEAAIGAGYRGDVGGLRARLSWTLTDGTQRWIGQATWAERDIAARIRPMFPRWEAPAAILAAALAENAKRGSPLLCHDVRALVIDEGNQFMRWHRSRRGRHAR